MLDQVSCTRRCLQCYKHPINPTSPTFLPVHACHQPIMSDQSALVAASHTEALYLHAPILALYALIELAVTHLCFVQSHHLPAPHHSCIMRTCPLASERSGLMLPGTPRLGHTREAISLRTQPPLLCNLHSPAWSSGSILRRYLTPCEPILASDLCYSVGTSHSWTPRPFHVSYRTRFHAFYCTRFHAFYRIRSPPPRLIAFALVLSPSLSSYRLRSHLIVFALMSCHIRLCALSLASAMSISVVYSCTVQG